MIAKASPPSRVDQVAFGRYLAQPIRGLAQQGIAEWMAEGIVHRLELVKVEAQQRQTLAAVQRPGQFVAE